jgi:hypothetical protein
MRSESPAETFAFAQVMVYFFEREKDSPSTGLVGSFMESLLICTLAIVGIYYVWLAYRSLLRQRHQVLRERVAYMLWIAAERTEQTAP